jgi:hypothetical protein
MRAGASDRLTCEFSSLPPLCPRYQCPPVVNVFHPRALSEPCILDHIRTGGCGCEAMWAKNVGTRKIQPTCWRRRFKRGRVQDSPRQTESDPRADGQRKRVSGAAKASAAEEPNETVRSESQETWASEQREPTSILIWGRPMGLDAEWQEIFVRRERRSE